MPNVAPPVEFKKGERLTADKLNQAIAPRRLAQPGSFRSGAFDVQRRVGGASSTENLTSKAVVTDAAGASTHDQYTGITGGTTGKAVLLTQDGADLKPSVVIDPGDPDYDATAATEAKIEFKSIHRVACAVGVIVELSSDSELAPGSTFDDSPVWGKLSEVTDYLWEVTGAGEMTGLMIPEGATAAADIQWDGVPCPPPPE
jgi:hypothetical protein